MVTVTLLGALLLAEFLGMNADELKEAGIVLTGIVMLYLQYRAGHDAREAKREAISAKDQALEATNKASESKEETIRGNAKLGQVEKEMNGHMTQLLANSRQAGKQEGMEQGKAETKAESTSIQEVVKDAIIESVPVAVVEVTKALRTPPDSTSPPNPPEKKG